MLVRKLILSNSIDSNFEINKIDKLKSIFKQILLQND